MGFHIMIQLNNWHNICWTGYSERMTELSHTENIFRTKPLTEGGNILALKYFFSLWTVFLVFGPSLQQEKNSSA